MLTKYKDVGPKKSVKGPLKNAFMSAAFSEFFSLTGHQIFSYFQRIFSGRIMLKHIENKKDCGRFGGVLAGKFF